MVVFATMIPPWVFFPDRIAMSYSGSVVAMKRMAVPRTVVDSESVAANDVILRDRIYPERDSESRPSMKCRIR